MPAIDQDFPIGIDRTVILTIPILDAQGNPYNLSGGSALWGMAQTKESPALISKSTVAGGIVLSEVNGVWQAVVTINPADTTGLIPGLYVHELAVQNQYGNNVTATVGKVSLYGSINIFS